LAGVIAVVVVVEVAAAALMAVRLISLDEQRRVSKLKKHVLTYTSQTDADDVESGISLSLVESIYILGLRLSEFSE
jgi:hypothetical protein